MTYWPNWVHGPVIISLLNNRAARVSFYPSRNSSWRKRNPIEISNQFKAYLKLAHNLPIEASTFSRS